MTGDQPGFLPRFRRWINAGPAADPSGWAGVAAVGAFFLVMVAFCLIRITDTDLFWHLASGDLIRRTGAVPRADPFSYTAAGLPWINLHWLFQVGASWLNGAGGMTALTSVKTVLIAGLFIFLYRRCRRHAGAAASVAVMLLALLASQERFLTRPEIFSWWFLALVLVLLGAALGTESVIRRRALLFVALPLVQVIWVNLQGLFLLGWALTALALAAATAGALWPTGKGARRSERTALAVDLLVALAFGSVACLANPNGPAAVRLALEQLIDHLGGESLLSRTIVEFQPTLAAGLATPMVLAFLLLAAATVLALLLNHRRLLPPDSPRLFEALAALALLVVAFKARRNVPLFAIAAAPILLRHGSEALAAFWTRRRRTTPAGAALSRLLSSLPSWAAPLALAAACLLLCGDVVSNRFFLRQPSERWWGVGLIPDYFPEESARFIDRASLPGQVFHSLWAGGYLIKAWDGDRRVFIDGRNDPFKYGVLETYLKVIAAPALFEEMAQRYQITTVVWPHQRALEGKALLAWLAAGNGWVLVHLDAAAAVYARSDLISPSLAVLQPFGGAPPPEVYAHLLAAVQQNRFSGPPIRELALGMFFSVSGDPRGAEFFLREALRRLPRSAPVWHDYGLALERQGRLKEARDAYAASLAADPGFSASQGALGVLLLDGGELRDAEKQLDAAYRAGERGAATLTARARLLDRQGKGREAAEAWGEAILAAPERRSVLFEAARFYAGRNEPGPALALYGRVLAKDVGDAPAAAEKALILQGLGRQAEALVVARKAAEQVVARRAAGPAQAGRAGKGWIGAQSDDAGGRSAHEEDRLLEVAAVLEEAAGDPELARKFRNALRR